MWARLGRDVGMDGRTVVAMDVTSDRGLYCGRVGGVRVGVGGAGWGGRCSIFTPCVDARGCEKCKTQFLEDMKSALRNM